jgi:hypothetical protein
LQTHSFPTRRSSDLTSSPSSSSATYAIPLGITPVPSSSGQTLRFPFSIPAGSYVYVQIVATPMNLPPSSVKVVVQLQYLNEPINP